jgi:membrane dipeptidase
MLRVIDGHCDVLSKMFNDPRIDMFSDQHLDVTLPRMKEVQMMMQLFAIYLPERITRPQFHHLLQFVQLFHERVLCLKEIIFIRSQADLHLALKQNNKTGALLTLEGADALAGNSNYLHILFYLGVRCLGITWNYANWAADGVKEPRQGGFTNKGKRFVRECNKLGMLLDASHLTEKAFWELVECSTVPFIASHSNAHAVCRHPRNLKDDQIQAVIQINGRIGLTFVPYFISRKEVVTITDLLKHIDHICALGGSRHIAFGSDFDGIDQWVVGLEHTGKYADLYQLLLKYYRTDEVEGFMWKNWFDFYAEYLPEN